MSMFRSNNPADAMPNYYNMNYGSSPYSYPEDITETSDLHSFMRFAIQNITPVQHLKAGSSGISSTGNAHTTIQLYIPEQVGVQQEVAYKQDESRVGLAGLRGLDQGKIAMFEKAFGGLQGVVEGGVQAAADTFIGSGGLIAAQRDKIGNAAQYQLLEGTQFRQFEFQYKFVPKSSTEAGNVKRIVKAFRTYMMPEIDEEMFFYKAPNTFQISYHVGGREGTLHKFKPCVLTSCNVSYGGDGSFGVFKDGEVAHTEMTVTFLELLQVTQTDVKGGY